MTQSAREKPTFASDELQWICRSTLQANFPLFREVEIEARFYPYMGLTHTIRRRENRWTLRISDHCRHAPRAVLEAIAILLACKVLRRKSPEQSLKVYDNFRHQPEIEEAVRERRLRRGRKQIRQHDGRHHSLRAIFRSVNEQYFNGQVNVRRIGWGPRRSRLRLGHYDPVHETITISPTLDSPEVPEYVVSYLVYHEMLHTLFGINQCAGRYRHHPPAFKKAERAHPDYEKAKRFLAGFCRRAKR